MTVLVTGGAGYIGSHMVHALADAGNFFNDFTAA
jgi:UDP-glucose 4-epimerase